MDKSFVDESGFSDESMILQLFSAFVCPSVRQANSIKIFRRMKTFQLQQLASHYKI